MVETWFQKLGRYLFNIKEQHTTAYPLSPEQLNANNLLKEAKLKVTTLEAQLAKKSADEKMAIAEEQKKNVEDDMKAALKEQSLEFKQKKYGRTFDFNKFYEAYFKNKKMMESLEITDKDDTVILGKFGSFRIVGNKIALYDANKRIVTMGSQLQHVIYKPESLANQIKRGRIAVPLDSEGNYVPDMELELMPEVSWNDDDKKFEVSKHIQKPFIKMLVEKEERILGLSDEIQNLESVNIKLSRQLTDLKRALISNKIIAEASQTEVSKILSTQYDTTRMISDIHKRNLDLHLQANSTEKALNGALQVVAVLREKLNDVLSNPDVARVWDDMEHKIRFAKDMTPRVINQTIIPETASREAPNPNQILKKEES